MHRSHLLQVTGGEGKGQTSWRSRSRPQCWQGHNFWIRAVLEVEDSTRGPISRSHSGSLQCSPDLTALQPKKRTKLIIMFSVENTSTTHQTDTHMDRHHSWHCSPTNNVFFRVYLYL